MLERKGQMTKNEIEIGELVQAWIVLDVMQCRPNTGDQPGVNGFEGIVLEINDSGPSSEVQLDSPQFGEVTVPVNRIKKLKSINE